MAMIVPAAAPDASAQWRPAPVSLARYIAAFNSESTANQVTLDGIGTAAHLSRADAAQHALRQEPGAVVLGSGVGTFKSVRFHYKPVPVWVFALDPRGPHNQPCWGPPGTRCDGEYDYDVVVEAAGSGAPIEEALGWDKNLPPLSSESHAGHARGPAPAPTAEAQAVELLDAAVLPPGSREVASLPEAVFSVPGVRFGCSPVYDKQRYWEVKDDPGAVASFLVAHAPAWAPNQTHGQGTFMIGQRTVAELAYEVGDVPRGRGWGSSDMLAFTVAAIPHGLSGVRADGEAAAPHAECTRS